VADHGVYKGKEGVRRFYIDLIKGGKDRKPRPGVLAICMQMQGVITVEPDGKTAEGRWQTWLCEAKQYGAFPRQEWLHGYYENKYIKEEGKWKFLKLHWNNTFCSPFEDGWLKTPLMGWMPFPEADAPPTAFHPYPSGYHLPYHYKHPITGE
jgi:hypothetical protein